MTRPRRSTRITGLHRYHGAVRPCAARRYSGPRGFCRSDGSLSRPAAGQHRATDRSRYHSAGSHVPHRSPGQARATSRPDATWPISRHPPGSSRACRTSPVSTSSLNISTRHQWFTRVRLLDLHLTRSPARLFPQRSPPRLLTAAACGGLRPPPAGRPRRLTRRKPALHLRCSTASVDPIFYIRSPFCVRGALRRRCWSARLPRW